MRFFFLNGECVWWDTRVVRGGLGRSPGFVGPFVLLALLRPVSVVAGGARGRGSLVPSSPEAPRRDASPSASPEGVRGREGTPVPLGLS